MTNLVTLNDPRSATAEAWQSLRTNLEFSGLDPALRASGEGGRSLQTLLLATPDASADKSAAIANLAVVMAQAGDRVVIVDGDLRKPAQHEIFGASNARGLSTLLAEGGAPALLKTSVDNLSLLPAGPAPANPVAILSNKRLASLLSDLRTSADWVLIDAPPVLAVTDAALWASLVDGVVLLLNAGATKRDHAQRARTVLEKVHANILGAVLLNADRDAVASGYGS